MFVDISFSARLEGRISYNGGDKIVFPNVFTNVGDAYDSITGIFTAPHNGTYQFMVFSVGTTGTQFAWITVNGEQLALSHGRVSWSQGKCRRFMVHLFSSASAHIVPHARSGV